MCAGISDHDDPRFSCDCHLLGPEGCTKCGEPFNDADAPADGLCVPCRTAAMGV